MSFFCWWCGEMFEDEKKEIRSYQGVSDETFCPACANGLDQWSDEQWAEYYDHLDELNNDDYDYGNLFPLKPKRTCRVEGCDNIPEVDEDYCDEHILEP